MYNKLCNKLLLLFFIGHVCIMDKDHQMKFKRYINHSISSSYVWLMATFSSFIMLNIIIKKFS